MIGVKIVYTAVGVVGVVSTMTVGAMIHEIMTIPHTDAVEYLTGPYALLVASLFVSYFSLRWAVRYVNRIEEKNQKLSDDIIKMYQDKIKELEK